jgi:DNA-binding response OmpR family regulator
MAKGTAAMAHILVVDDDERAAEHAAQVLIDAGHACGWIGDAETAMKIIQRKRPDLLLLEEELPGENGTALLRRLRNSPKFYDLPVIMLTARAGFKEEQIAITTARRITSASRSAT